MEKKAACHDKQTSDSFKTHQNISEKYCFVQNNEWFKKRIFTKNCVLLGKEMVCGLGR